MEINDLSTAGHETPSECEIFGVDGEKTDVVISVLGADSKTARISSKVRLDEVVAETKGKGNGKDPKFIAEVMQEAELRVVADCTAGWKGLQSEGEDYELSYESALEFYRKVPYIVAQLNVHMREDGNFIKG